MEQSRSFIVILSVTLVLAGFFGVAAILSTPGTQAALASAGNADSSAIARFFRDAEAGTTGASGLGPATDSVTVDTAINSATVNSILEDAASLGQQSQSNQPSITVETSSNLTVQSTSPASSAASAASASSAVAATPAKELGGPNYTGPATARPASTSASPAATSASSSRTAAAPASTSGTRSTATAGTAGTATQGPASAAAQLNEKEYWIQVISSPSRNRVELAQRDLENFGLGGRIGSYKVDDVDYYRLRYGPYTEEAEAEKFLAWIRELPNYRAAFISLEQRSGS